MSNPLPLEGVRVIEFTHMVMGPTCGLVLADLGAEVIKIEPVGGDNTRKLLGSGAGFFSMFNRNKKSLAVDIKTDKGKEIVLNEIPISAAEQPKASRALDAIRGHSHQPVTLDQAPPSEAQSETVDHSSAYADHAAAIEAASTALEWQNAYTTAWQWAESTGSDEIKKGIRQLAGEAKKKLPQQ